MRSGAALVLSILVSACQGGDAPIPLGYEALVDSARRGLLSHTEGLLRPSLAFTGLRCYANGGLVILFLQVGGQTPGEPAFAMGGLGSTDQNAAWSGGFGEDGMREEIEFNYGDVPEIACPAAPG